jgi:hypothetical protein
MEESLFDKKNSNNPKVGDLYKSPRTNAIFKITKISGNKISVKIVANSGTRNMGGEPLNVGDKGWIEADKMSKWEKIEDPKNIKLHATKDYFNPNEDKVKEESSEKINQPEYKFYTCQIFKDHSLNICQGFEFENDDKDSKKEEETYGRKDFMIKVFSKRFLSSQGINPDEDRYWKDPQEDGTRGGQAKLKVKKEEFQDNTPPEPVDGSEVDVTEKAKLKIDQGKMHKILGVPPGEDIESKYESGEGLYKALSSKLKDHGKVMKMLNFAANISKEKDIFDAAVRYGKEHSPQKETFYNDLDSAIQKTKGKDEKKREH